MRSFSYGGGVQSTAALVLAAEGRIDYRLFLFANVGDDSEHPATLEYLEKWAKPFAAAHDIALHELRRHRRDGEVETLYGRLVKEGSKSLPIPVRMSNGVPGTRRCTADFKIRVITKWLREHGATEAEPAIVGIGISTDEVQRMNNRRLEKCEITEYPLIDLRLSRDACAEVIRRAGLPVPHKSSCYFCPFHRIGTWAEMRRDEPELFAKSVALETLLNDRRARLGKDPVYFNSRAVPLERIAEAQAALFGDEDEAETCDAFSCFT
ncbi:MAG: phosphoadenosine phosphosulfate reductase [Chloroflexi bacterium]|nr:phosphoadenosine phosphosulfate reductase [Chloroflexota bacterium]